MFNSQHAIDIAKAYKVLIASLFVIFLWQYFTTHAGFLIQHNTKTVETPTQTPADIQQQLILSRYKNAKFLSIVPTVEKVRYSKLDLFCMAKNIYHEAGNQSRLGKFAVAQVTINRMKHPEFSSTVCGVVFAPYQFSWANNRKLRWITPHNNMMWEESKEIATEALKQGFRVKGMEDAIYYHATYVQPNWKNVNRFVRIGAHVFYKEV